MKTQCHSPLPVFGPSLQSLISRIEAAAMMQRLQQALSTTPAPAFAAPECAPSVLPQRRDDLVFAPELLPRRPQLALPECGFIPAPSIEQSTAPAGKGLTKDPAGFPPGSVRTAGGYTIVPEGKDNAFSIYGPGQTMKDKPQTRVWGDPHVDEGDGDRWDFTKDTGLRLPDGTLIAVTTTSQTGQSVTRGLNIVNGADRVEVTGIDKNRPQVSEVKGDGFAWRQAYVDATRGQAQFVLGGTGKDVRWFAERDGDILGQVTGTIRNVDGKGSYGQKIDPLQGYFVDPSLKPRTGTDAWGNMLRNEAADVIGRLPLPEVHRQILAAYLGFDHQVGALESAARRQSSFDFLRSRLFGGLFTSPVFDGLPSVFRSLRQLDVESQLQSILGSACGKGRAAHLHA